MFDRTEPVKAYVNQILECLNPTPERKVSETVHTYSSAEFGALLALRRGLDPELAYIAGLLHDNYAYKTGSYTCHAQNGAEMAREFLSGLGTFTDAELTTICSAIYRHATKGVVHGPYDEVMKDADVIQPYLFGKVYQKPLPEGNQRMKRMLAEFVIPGADGCELTLDTPSCSAYCGEQLAKLAGELADKAIRADRDNGDFKAMLKYFPEDDAYEKLCGDWNSLFVYHCVQSVGIQLPLRQSPLPERFTVADTWRLWGNLNGFTVFGPARAGDIALVNGAVGIVLASENGKLTVAAGNVDGVSARTIWDAAGASLVRIPDGYVYDGVKFDYQLPGAVVSR